MRRWIYGDLKISTILICICVTCQIHNRRRFSLVYLTQEKTQVTNSFFSQHLQTIGGTGYSRYIREATYMPWRTIDWMINTQHFNHKCYVQTPVCLTVIIPHDFKGFSFCTALKQVMKWRMMQEQRPNLWILFVTTPQRNVNVERSGVGGISLIL